MWNDFMRIYLQVFANWRNISHWNRSIYNGYAFESNGPLDFVCVRSLSVFRRIMQKGTTMKICERKGYARERLCFTHVPNELCCESQKLAKRKTQAFDVESCTHSISSACTACWNIPTKFVFVLNVLCTQTHTQRKEKRRRSRKKTYRRSEMWKETPNQTINLRQGQTIIPKTLLTKNGTGNRKID